MLGGLPIFIIYLRALLQLTIKISKFISIWAYPPPPKLFERGIGNIGPENSFLVNPLLLQHFQFAHGVRPRTQRSKQNSNRQIDKYTKKGFYKL